MSDKNDVVIINLDRPRMLWYGHKALKTLGALTGKDIDAAMSMEELDLGELEKVMYCGLLTDAKAHNEVLKLEDMEDLLDMAPSFGEIILKMQEAFNACFGNIGDVEKNFQGIAVSKKK
jgi:hypothetical protein